ncbi:hypothetical protein EZV62_027901 [Acer yangbiense]|uniref:Protein kinase domain-containing protein n=1 Tax=Acer yangbiense TaxID=1000413 RepID=A0A5C7GP52_9ROSI|nr:hypothetical protein EZV62_027901 [Acer yangbiense]
MLDARGTIGYTAPEVFCRNFGGVSHKSDVYGFRMMVLEMVGARQRTVGDHESNTSEIYFPEWIYKQIEGSNDLIVDGIINEEEEVIARKMILVSLWCIQTNPSDRPAMSKALEMLEGSSSSSNPNYLYESCNIQFQCGNIKAVYPFWGESHQGLRPWGCTGHPELKLNCEDEGDVATMMINEVKCRVLDIKWKDKTLRNARMDYLEGICSLAFHNTTINHEILDYSDGYENIQSSSSNPNYNKYESCNIEFKCGNITAGYPFWGGPQQLVDCGHPELKLNCEDEGLLDPFVTMMIKGVKYRVLEIKSVDKTLRIERMYYLEPERICSPAFHNTTINREKLDYSEGYENVTFIYYCLPPKSIPCYIEAGYDDPGNCDASVFFPIPKNSLNWKRDDESLRRVLDKGFEWKWKLRDISCENCNNSKEVVVGTLIARKQSASAQISQILAPPVHVVQDHHSAKEGCLPCPWVIHSPVNSCIAAGVVGIIIILSIFLIRGLGRSLILHMFAKFSKNKTENCQNMEAFVRNFGSLASTRYNYSDVKRMTNSFSNKLGQGGYGDVYKGKLPDGRLVAVKFLKESKGNGEEFTNEVASISRTSHVNIVNLLGFCYERNKRALIYEFMPNGSLDKFIYDQESSTTKSSLEWKTMYQIAVGIARGLEYLHRGCNTRIVHFDIKPHNILLDEDFCPKISDFGLAKLCKKKESIISMLGARGTIGYIAPEIFCRTFGEVSHRSDVYSYGMMILEMVGGRKNIDVRVSHTSEIYFPNWIYKQLEPGNDFELHGAIIEEEGACQEDGVGELVVHSNYSNG